LRLISRLTVEGAWPSSRAIDLIERAAAIPREISSRSLSVNASRERCGIAGRMPPCAKWTLQGERYDGFGLPVDRKKSPAGAGHLV
jgi:hypothetical protein